MVVFLQKRTKIKSFEAFSNSNTDPYLSVDKKNLLSMQSIFQKQKKKDSS